MVAIQTEVSQALKASQEHKSLNAACDLACHLCEIVCTEELYPIHGHQLLLNLFKVSFNCDDEHPLDEKAVARTSSTWIKCLGLLLDGLNQGECEQILVSFFEVLEEDFSSIITSKLRGHYQTLSDRIQTVWDTISHSNFALGEWLLEFLMEKTELKRRELVTLCKVIE